MSHYCGCKVYNHLHLCIMTKLIKLFCLHYFQETLSPNKSRNPERIIVTAFQLMCLQLARICWGHSPFEVISDKVICVAKSLIAFWETFSYENDCNYNPCKFGCKFSAITFLPFLSFQIFLSCNYFKIFPHHFLAHLLTQRTPSPVHCHPVILNLPLFSVT